MEKKVEDSSLSRGVTTSKASILTKTVSSGKKKGKTTGLKRKKKTLMIALRIMDTRGCRSHQLKRQRKTPGEIALNGGVDSPKEKERGRPKRKFYCLTRRD